MNRVVAPGRRRPSARVPTSKRFFFLLIGLFLLLAPASVSGSEREFVSTLKWARVGVLIVISLVGLRWFRLPGLSDLSGKLLLLAIVFAMSAVWSTSPAWGLLYKGMFVCATGASLCLANCMRTESDFRSFARMMTFVALSGGLLVGYLIFFQQDFEFWNGRLVVAELNPNLMAMSASVFVLLCVFHLLIGDSGIWRLLPIVLIGAMCVLIIYSGSRSAALTVVAGGLLLLPAIGKSRRHAVLLFLLSLLALMVVGVLWFSLFSEAEEQQFGQYESIEPDESLRLFGEIGKDTRLNIWSFAIRRWTRDSPFLGVGWLNAGNRWLLVQSSYLQVAVESGVAGICCVLVFLFGGVMTLRRALWCARYRKGANSTLLYLFAATFFAVIFHGIFESSMVVGSSPNAILLGFSAAQLDSQIRYARNAVRGERPQHPRQNPGLVQKFV